MWSFWCEDDSVQVFALEIINGSHTVFSELVIMLYEEFEDTKGVIRILISKKNRQFNGKKNPT